MVTDTTELFAKNKNIPLTNHKAGNKSLSEQHRLLKSKKSRNIDNVTTPVTRPLLLFNVFIFIFLAFIFLQFGSTSVSKKL